MTSEAFGSLCLGLVLGWTFLLAIERALRIRGRSMFALIANVGATAIGVSLLSEVGAPMIDYVTLVAAVIVGATASYGVKYFSRSKV